MFTGIVEELGTVRRIQSGSQSIVLTIEAEEVLNDIEIGASIATNGVCLTVTEFGDDSFKADVMPETMNKSNLGDLQVGDPVNLERALQVGDRLGGHFVSGHIDEVGKIVERTREDNAIIFTIKPSPSLLKYVAPKGSVAVDGISLTVADLEKETFSISVIPHTAEATVLGDKGPGDKVNLEADMIGKYVERLINNEVESGKAGSQKEVNRNLLQEKGFLLA